MDCESPWSYSWDPPGESRSAGPCYVAGIFIRDLHSRKALCVKHPTLFGALNNFATEGTENTEPKDSWKIEPAFFTAEARRARRPRRWRFSRSNRKLASLWDRRGGTVGEADLRRPSLSGFDEGEGGGEEPEESNVKCGQRLSVSMGPGWSRGSHNEPVYMETRSHLHPGVFTAEAPVCACLSRS